MSRSLTALAGVAALALLAACNPPNTTGSASAPPPGAAPGVASGPAPSLETASQAAVDAQRQFQTLAAAGMQPGGRVPGLSDPAARPLLEKVFDTRALTGATAPDFDHLDPLQNWLMAVVTVGQSFMLSGTGKTSIVQISNDPVATQQVERNMTAYAPEIGRYIDTQNAVERLEVISIANHLASHPDVEGSGGLAKVRGGVAQTLNGEFAVIGDPSTSDDWRRARMPSLQALATEAAKLLTPEQKARMQAAAEQAAGQMRDPGLNASLHTVAMSFSQ